jgi:hypothetical protein
MKKAKEVKYGIEITKPWSKEMYAHNEEVMAEICDTVLEMWEEAYAMAESDFEDNLEEDQQGMLFSESDWSNANEKMQDIQDAVTMITYGSGFDIKDVQDSVFRELDCIRETAYRAKEMAEDLGLELEKEIIGFK